MRVILTTEAKADLTRIADYIAADNPTRARSFVRNLQMRAREIGDTPHGFPLVPHYERTGVRRRVHGNYLIFYRIEETRISVIAILHGARDFEKILFPDV